MRWLRRAYEFSPVSHLWRHQTVRVFIIQRTFVVLQQNGRTIDTLHLQHMQKLKVGIC